jgi:hypothetical protein
MALTKKDNSGIKYRSTIRGGGKSMLNAGLGQTIMGGRDISSAVAVIAVFQRPDSRVFIAFALSPAQTPPGLFQMRLIIFESLVHVSRKIPRTLTSHHLSPSYHIDQAPGL